MKRQQQDKSLELSAAHCSQLALGMGFGASAFGMRGFGTPGIYGTNPYYSQFNKNQKVPQNKMIFFFPCIL